MSYSENYQANVAYSGSVHYNYPASQNGGSGTAHYSGEIPVHVTINVNTRPFDGSVDHFNNSIDVLGGSVTAMHIAQCAAIQQTAAEVSQSLVNGFFGTINTELSQQLQALDSAIKAVFGLLQAQGKAVSDKKGTMESDYNRISSRYVSLFNDLDKECYKRIYALDKQSFNLSEKVQRQLISESTSDTAALNLLGIEELSSSKTLVFVSSLNRKSLDVLKTLHEYITQESEISALIDSFLSADEVAENKPIFIPVIWAESDMLEGGDTCQECYMPAYIDSQEKPAIAEELNRFCSASSKWEAAADSEKESLNREFNALAEAHFTDTNEETEQRIYKTMLSLWQDAELHSLERS